MSKHDNLTRRAFLNQLSLAGITAPLITNRLLAQSPNGLLRHASIGAGGKAVADIQNLTANKFLTLVAVADVDSTYSAAIKKQHPDIRVYLDWRELLDKEGQNIDSVNVSTPDHMHAPAAMSALQQGKHVYCQKPLTHDVFESRQLALVAREKMLVTQMGIQNQSTVDYRLAVQYVQAGVIGKIKEVHAWCFKKWGDPKARPAQSDPVPANMNWDLWLGIAAVRPFIGNGYYHPGNWRKRLDFGTGTFGDMGCHIYDPIFKALALTAPLSVRSEGPPPNAFNWATDAVVHYVFPGTPFTEGQTVNVTWYDGDQKPPKEIQELLKVEPGTKRQPAVSEPATATSKKGRRKETAPQIQGEYRIIPPQGSIFIGTKGIMLLPHIAKPELFPEAQYEDFQVPKLPVINHYTQFAEACIGQGNPTANFDYAGPLTEAVLLGSVATRYPKTTLQWNAAKLEFSNCADAGQYLRRPYRQGWAVKALS
jgi:predicted dehydrogenase